jgi:hypothetical protein
LEIARKDSTHRADNNSQSVLKKMTFDELSSSIRILFVAFGKTIILAQNDKSERFDSWRVATKTNMTSMHLLPG